MAEDIISALDSLNPDDFIKSQDSSTTANTFPTPDDCDDLNLITDSLTNALDSSDLFYDLSKAEAEAFYKLSIDLYQLHNSLYIVCNSSDIDELCTAKNAAKVTAEALAKRLTDLISEKTDESNDLRLRILALNQQISAAGGTTAHPAFTVDMEGEI